MPRQSATVALGVGIQAGIARLRNCPCVALKVARPQKLAVAERERCFCFCGLPIIRRSSVTESQSRGAGNCIGDEMHAWHLTCFPFAAALPAMACGARSIISGAFCQGFGAKKSPRERRRSTGSSRTSGTFATLSLPTRRDGASATACQLHRAGGDFLKQ
jgi:hypothetical protein